eukprot:6188459-Pleurochrysis_carterae.AAC.6
MSQICWPLSLSHRSARARCSGATALDGRRRARGFFCEYIKSLQKPSSVSSTLVVGPVVSYNSYLFVIVAHPCPRNAVSL